MASEILCHTNLFGILEIEAKGFYRPMYCFADKRRGFGVKIVQDVPATSPNGEERADVGPLIEKLVRWITQSPNPIAICKL